MMAECKYKHPPHQFVKTRANQEYCDAKCRAKQNNLIAKGARDIIGGDNLQLLRNFRILDKLIDDHPFSTEVTISELERLGFIQEVYTGHRFDEETGVNCILYYCHYLTQISETKYKVGIYGVS